MPRKKNEEKFKIVSEESDIDVPKNIPTVETPEIPEETSSNDIPEGIPHVVTAEDLENNPAFVENDIEVGDTIYLPEENVEVPEDLPLPKEEKVKVNPLPTPLVSKPYWVDPLVWERLDEEKRVRLCRGESLSKLN